MHRHRDDRVVHVRLGDVDVWIERLVTKDLLRARIEEIAPHVRLGVATAMRVDDIDLCRAAGEKTIDDGVEIGREHLLSLGILLRMTEEEGAPIVLAGESLHVVVDEDADWRVRTSRGCWRESPSAGRDKKEEKSSDKVKRARFCHRVES